MSCRNQRRSRQYHRVATDEPPSTHNGECSGATTRVRTRPLAFGCAPTRSEDNTLQLLKQLNYNLQETTAAVAQLKSTIEPSGEPSDLNLKLAHKTRIELRVLVCDVWNVDLASGSFCADVIIQAKWHDPALDELNQDESELVDWGSLWTPCLTLGNLSADRPIAVDVTARAMVTGKNGLNMVVTKRHVSATFNFTPATGLLPFDSQSLPIEIVSSRDTDEVVLEEDEYQSSCISGGGGGRCHNLPGYTLYPLVTCSSDVRPDLMGDGLQPLFTCTVTVARKWATSVFSVFLPVFLLSFLSVVISQMAEGEQRNVPLVLIGSVITLLTALVTTSSGGPSMNITASYLLLHAVLTISVAIKEVAEDLGLCPALQLSFSTTSVNISDVIPLLLFLAINLLAFLVISVALFVRWFKMKRLARVMTKKQNDYKMLRSGREKSVQSFSHLTKSQAPPAAAAAGRLPRANTEGTISAHSTAPRSISTRSFKEIPV